MKQHFTLSPLFLFLLGIALLQTACNKKDDSQPAPETVTGEKRPTGVSEGAAINKIIGTEGGTIALPGNAITVTVPAGALSEPTSISIEPITNTNLAGIGKAFRLTPHGKQFNKPVAISFSYAVISDSISSPDVLGLAYQDNNGVWQFTGGSVVDTAQKTVTYNSTHFSDWSMMPWLMLRPYNSILAEGEEKNIQAYRFIPFEKCECLFMPIPKFGSDYPVGDPVLLDRKHIESWNLVGPGTLIPTTGNEGVYKAPANIPLNTSATVIVKLKSELHTLLLQSNITLLSNSTFEIRLNNGPWKSLPVALVQLFPGKLSIATDGTVKEKLSMFFPQKKGSFAWDEDDNGDIVTGFNYFPAGAPSPVYMPNYDDETKDWHYSSGNITITELGDVGQFTTGAFKLSPSGLYEMGKQISKATIEGRFRLKRAM